MQLKINNLFEFDLTLNFQAPARLIYMVDIAMPDTALLRVTTLMANIAASAKRLKINPTYDLPAEGKAPAPDTLYFSFISNLIRS